MLADRRTKIVATIGPAINTYEGLKQAIEAGMNVARLNFSHGTHEDHLSVLKNIRQLSVELKAPVTVLQDLQGPKIRVGILENGSIELVEGEEVVISPSFDLGSGIQIPTDFDELPQSCKEGTKILLDDGLMELRVLRVEGDKVFCKVIFGGILKNRKGMNLPDEDLPVDCMTPKDIADLEFGLANGVDYVALSFVRRGSDLKKLREIIEQKKPSTKIISKIEMREAIENLNEIVALSDAVMVARGDLAVEVGQTQLPLIQKRIIHLSNEMGKPVITATQMLDSMVSNPRPTRAEITDVANAVLDGTDAVMLSAESASGKYPFKCIRTMHEIVTEVEKNDEIYYKFDLDDDQEPNVPESIAASASLSALNLDASAIVCLTTSGRTATIISKLRPKAKIIAITHRIETLNRLELVWGIQTYAISPYNNTDEAMDQIERILLQYGLISNKDRVVLTLGVPVAQGAKTNSLRVYTITGEKNSNAAVDDLPLRCR